VKVPFYSEIKEQEAKRRRVVIGLRGSRSAMAHQRQVSLVGDGAKVDTVSTSRTALSRPSDAFVFSYEFIYEQNSSIKGFQS
jgi:hypothetical protein